jgi:transposase
MENRDARTLSPDAQEELRMRAVNMVNNGMTRTEVGRMLGVTRQHVGEWCKRYAQGGVKALKKQKRGIPLGANRKLTAEQELEVQKTMVDKTPDQLKMKFALWTREAVRELIEQRYGVKYAMQSLSVLLKRWGFTPQRPIKKAYEQNPQAVKTWLDKTYPSIEKRAISEKAEIFWGDESAVKPEAHNRRSFAPKGQTPVIRQPAQRFHSSFISAISKQGKLHWMGLSKPLDADLFIDFLKRLIKNRKRKIFLILDNLKVHHCQKVKDWVELHKHRIELFYLPSYSPELNPDEYLNQGLKKVIFQNGIAKDKAELDAKLNVSLFMFEIRPAMVQSFFRHPKVRYAA